MSISKEEIIEKLSMEPLEIEGGYFAISAESDENIDIVLLNREDDRKKDEESSASLALLYKSIYYMVTKAEFSHMHALKSDEIWFWHYGESLNMFLMDKEGNISEYTLGSDLSKGEVPMLQVKRGIYMGAYIDSRDENTYALTSTIMAPGFRAEDFILGTYESLSKLCKDKEKLPLLRKLCRM